MPRFEYNGRSVFYTEHGQVESTQPPLVLLHGAGGVHLHWPPHLRRSTAGVVYALDLPGHGRSAGPGFATIAGHRDCVLAWAEALALPPFVAVGHSMGSAIALDLALTSPARLAGLVLVGASSRLKVAPAILQGLQSDFDATIDLITRYSYGPAVTEAQRRKHAQQLAAVGAGLLSADFAACNAFDATAQLGAIALPTLIVGAHQDQMTPPRQSERLHQAIAHSELHLLDCGHMIPIEQPAALTALIQAFVRRIGGIPVLSD